MKLIIAIVHERDRQDICDLLLENNWRFTVVASTGGFLREGKSTLLIGAEDDQVDNILEVIKSASSSMDLSSRYSSSSSLEKSRSGRAR